MTGAAMPGRGRLRFAAPSFVLPGTVAENARFLAGRVEEVALCCFETAGSLAYTHADLPADLARLPLRWHLHLPVDLPWREGAEGAAAAALAVLDRLAALAPGLAPWAAVLHPPVELPPPARGEALATFAARWRGAGAPPLLLENIRGCQLTDLPAGADLLTRHGLGVCLDVGHLLGYAQADLLASDLPERAALVHWSAPGPQPGQDRHLPLTALTPGQRRTAQALLRRFSPGAVHLLEVFAWAGVDASRRWLAACAEGAAAVASAPRGAVPPPVPEGR